MDRGRSGGNGSEAYLQAVHGGPGPMRIAKLLQEEKVLNPTAYKRQIDIKTPIPETADPYHWNTNTVVNILERREYRLYGQFQDLHQFDPGQEAAGNGGRTSAFPMTLWALSR